MLNRCDTSVHMYASCKSWFISYNALDSVLVPIVSYYS